jgi:hypothetical protein
MNRLRLPAFALATLLLSAPLHAGEPDKAPPPAPAAPSASAPVDEPTRADDAAAALARAKERKKAGDRAMDALRFTDAYAAYSEVFALTRDPALLYNMGRALQALNRFPEALDRLEAFQAVAPPELKARVQRLDALIAELRGKVSSLKVTANVPGARVLVRSTVMGKLPLTDSIRTSAGPAEIEVEAEDHFPYRTTVDLPGGGEAKVDAKLFSKATTGLLSVRASAQGSVVYIDDRQAGFAPVELNVPGGTHKVKIKNPDFRDYETTTVVTNGTKKELDVKLLPPLIVTRWWFWGSVALAGAAAGVIGYAATTERAPDRGDIAPGQVRTQSFKIGAQVPVWRF